MRIKPNLFKVILFSCIVICAAAVTKAQAPAAGNVNTILSKIEAYNTAMPAEKAFLHFDKPYYSAGDTIWFKGYLMNDAINYSPLSSRLYVELLNDSNAMIKRLVFPVQYGITWGSIPLDQFYVHEGNYTIRAYTNWMRNFGDDHIFKQSFYINSPAQDTWLVNVRPSLTSDGANVGLKFTGTDNTAPGRRDLQLKVLNGKKILSRNNVQTDADGSVNVNFALPAQTRLKNLSIAAQDKLDKNRKALVPVNINRPQDVDVQFMPESGPMVAGIPSQVGFKAVGEDGKGIDIKGIIYDNGHNVVKTINTARYGMGAFDMIAEAGKTYTAEITLPGGGQKTIALPAALAFGSVLNIKNDMDKDTIAVSVFNRSEQPGPQKYYLIGMARGVVCYGASFNLNAHSLIKIAKNLFPTGVAHFVLLNAAQQPVNERATFINHDDNLKIELNSGAQAFASRDSIPVHIKVTDAAGKPVAGSFSMAVTDDSQVKPGMVLSKNILSQLLLADELKGYIENPVFYLQHNEQSWQALDALLLTQGWIGYDLKQMDRPVKPVYEPETEFTVKGMVTNLLNRPIDNSRVMLLSKGSQNFFKDTTTNAQGKFTFAKFPPITKSTFIISARNANGKVVNAGISVDEKNKSAINATGTISADPWNVNPDSTVLNFVRSNKSYHVALDKEKAGTSGRLLNTVNINAKDTVKNSHNLNGPGSADQTLTEEVMVNAGTSTLLDVIQSKVKDFRINFHKGSDKSVNNEYFIKDKMVRFIFDGVDIDRFYEPVAGIPNEHYDFQKKYLDQVSAEDILGIEVIFNHNGRYNAQSLTATADLLGADPTGAPGSDIAYLEITTRAGTGPSVNKATGIYIYKPLPLAEYRQFYRPRYTVKETQANNTDLRSTIHWAPNIVTDKDGMATVSFYAADKPTHYTILVEGGDMSGNIGVQTGKITIK